ncbi:MAG: hypothetical protein U0L26_13120 [Cellulosilyticum sp.]|nr:hypothetical protein [Cellulosilyticum sp.]
MKRWLMNIAILGIASITTLSGTGCQHFSEWREEEVAEHSYVVHNNIEEIVEKDETKWNQLVDEVRGIDNISVNQLNDRSYIEELGIYRANGYISFWQDTDDKKRLESMIGSEAEGFLDVMNKLEEGQSLEQVVNGYGLFATNMYKGNADIFVVESGLVLKDKMLKEKIDTLCDKSLLISAVSQGKEKRMIELAYPSYFPAIDYGWDKSKTAYYQLIMDHDGNIKKIKLLVRYSANSDRVLSEEKYKDLKYILEQVSGEEVDISNLQLAIAENMKENGKDSKGKVSDWNYCVTKSIIDSGYQEVTIIEIE